MINRILVPLDGSPSAEAVIPEIEKLATNFDAEIVLLKVVEKAPLEGIWHNTPPAGEDVLLGKMVPPMFHYAVSEPYGPMNAILVKEDTVADYYLRSLAEALTRRGLKVRAATRSGKVADTILNYAKEENVDLIAMSTHARSQASRVLRGSVAEKVVRESNVPVFLAKPTPSALARRAQLRVPGQKAS